MGMYKSAYTGTQIDDAVGKALNPDTTPTVGSKSLLTSGGAATSLSQKAPAGFGLGKNNGKKITSKDDINDCIDNGWYEWGGENPIHSPNSWCMMQVTAGLGCYIEQTIYSGNTPGIMMRRYKYDHTVWVDEWVNPPMATGIEYRTTERYRGKPVYKKLLEIPGLPSVIGSELSVEFVASNVFDKVVSFNAWMNYFGTSLPYKGVADVGINSSAIIITAERDLSLATALVSVSYTKK